MKSKTKLANSSEIVKIISHFRIIPTHRMVTSRIAIVTSRVVLTTSRVAMVFQPLLRSALGGHQHAKGRFQNP